MIPKLETGVPGLDIITKGGVPRDRSTLLVGKSGTGKTILALQMAACLARHARTLIVTVEETPEDLLTTGDQLGFGLREALDRGALEIADLVRPMDGPVLTSGGYDVNGLIHRLEDAVRTRGVRVVILDSVTALFSPRPEPDQLRNQFFQLVYSLRALGVTSVLVAEAPGDYGPITTLGVEDYVCDTVIVLRNIIESERRRRSIEVTKYRRSGHYKGEYPFTINPSGLIIFPLNPRERPEFEHIERYSSGLPGLDRMTGGGWLRNSIVIVRGPTGSGKTMVSGLYARAGAARGERVVYYGFEEPRPILLRNFAEIGMPMYDYLERGNLRVVCRYPEAISLEDLLVAVRMELEEFDPSLIVLDSISSIEHASSEKGFRQFIVGVASVLREYGRSALITETIREPSRPAAPAPYLSTIADAILNVDYSLSSPDLGRSIRLIKMRGSPHAREPYRLEIGPVGLSVSP